MKNLLGCMSPVARNSIDSALLDFDEPFKGSFPTRQCPPLVTSEPLQVRHRLAQRIRLIALGDRRRLPPNLRWEPFHLIVDVRRRELIDDAEPSPDSVEFVPGELGFFHCGLSERHAVVSLRKRDCRPFAQAFDYGNALSANTT